MKFSPEIIHELQDIFREERGIELTYEEAGIVAAGWVGFYDKLMEIAYRVQQDSLPTIKY